MGWLIVVGVVSVGLCLWGIISPQSLYWKGSAWQYRNPSANEPSDVSYGITRITSAVALVGVLIAGFTLAGYARDDARRADCREDLLPAFEKAVWNGKPNLADIRDFARERELEASMTSTGNGKRYVLTDDGREVLSAYYSEVLRQKPKCLD